MLWSEGMAAVDSFNVAIFSKPIKSLTANESTSLNLIDLLKKEKISKQSHQFIVSGDLWLKSVSPLYKRIQSKAKDADIDYTFTKTSEENFEPWSNKISLGKKFYSNFKNIIRIPFYSFNHDNAHLALFKDYYSNIDISDGELADLFILIEWFCISLDLILAFDLLRSSSVDSLHELNTIPNKHKHGINSTFYRNCGSLKSINQFAELFKISFITASECPITENLISYEVLENHRNYAKHTLVRNCRGITTKINSFDARNLIKDFRQLSLTELIDKKVGVNYEY